MIHFVDLDHARFCQHWPGAIDRRFYYHGRSKLVLIRALGPSLAASGVSPVLENPVLQLFNGSTQLRTNDDWQSASNSDDIIATALPPQDSKEASILVRLEPGGYTTIVTGADDCTELPRATIMARTMTTWPTSMKT